MSKPWLDRSYDAKIFVIPIPYLIRHLSVEDKHKVLGMAQSEKWQQAKEQAVKDSIASNKIIKPVKLVLHPHRDEFRVDDGISRIRAHFSLGYKKILCNVRVAEW